MRGNEIKLWQKKKIIVKIFNTKGEYFSEILKINEQSHGNSKVVHILKNQIYKMQARTANHIQPEAKYDDTCQ